jgi:hypothetical protein
LNVKLKVVEKQIAYAEKRLIRLKAWRDNLLGKKEPKKPVIPAMVHRTYQPKQQAVEASRPGGRPDFSEDLLEHDAKARKMALHIHRHGPATPGALAEMIKCSAASIYHILAGSECGGCFEKSSVGVTLTKQGRKQLIKKE